MKNPDISIFKDREKEAEFWEKNFKETWKRGKTVKVVFVKNLSGSLNIRLEPNVLSKVREQAKEKDLGPTQLIRMWVMEKIGAKPAY